MSYNDFGAGGGGGGGYQTTSYAGGGGFFSGSQAGSQGSPSKDVRKNTLRPVTIKQILEASQPGPEGTYHIDDQEVALVTFVGQIRNVVEQSINNTYKIEDGTGSLEVKQWIDPDRNSSTSGIQSETPQGAFQENTYVRVLGSLKGFQGKRHVASHMIRPITDFNEISYHLLEATAVHLLFTRGPPPDPNAPKQQGQGTNQGHTNNPYANNGYGGGGGDDVGMGGMGGGGGGGAQQDSGYGLPDNTTPAARKVFATIKSKPGSNEGVHVQAIAQAAGMPLSVVYKAVDELLNFGVAFTTLDDEHIACMDF